MNNVTVTIAISGDIARRSGDVVWDLGSLKFRGVVSDPSYIPAFLRDSAARLEAVWTARAEEGRE